MPHACQLYLTLLNTPVQLDIQVGEEQGPENVEVLCEHIYDGIQGMVARSCHPFCFLEPNHHYYYYVHMIEHHLCENDVKDLAVVFHQVQISQRP